MTYSRGIHDIIARMTAFLVMIPGLMAVGCSKDDGMEPFDGQETVNLASMESGIMANTRADGPYYSGYQTVATDEDAQYDVLWFDPVYEASSKTDEDAKLTTLCNDNPRSFTKTAGSDDWSSSLVLKSGRMYYIFAFTPVEKDSASIEPVRNDEMSPYDKARVTLKGIPAVSASDYLYSVGNSNPNAATPITADKAKGNFTYDVKATKGTGATNETYLIMNHLMSKLTLKLKADSAYGELRDIKLKSITAVPQSGSVQTISSVINYSKESVSFGWANPVTAGTVDTVHVFSPDTLVTLTTKFQEVGYFYFAPSYNAVPGQSVRPAVIFTFNVYDKEKQQTRKEVKVVNTSLLPQLYKNTGGLASGTNYIMSVTVKPTYLYVLSDNDPVSLDIELN